MLDNFTGFAPLGLVFVLMLGIGLVEQVGYLDYAVRISVSRVPSRLIPYVAVLIGIMGNIASDAAMVLIPPLMADRKSTRLNSSHVSISYAVFCLKKKI